jgi:hypothetical protein
MKRLPKALLIGGAEDDGGTGVMALERKATKARLAHAGEGRDGGQWRTQKLAKTRAKIRHEISYNENVPHVYCYSATNSFGDFFKQVCSM